MCVCVLCVFLLDDNDFGAPTLIVVYVVGQIMMILVENQSGGVPPSLLPASVSSFEIL